MQLPVKSDVLNGHLRASDKDSGSQASTRSSCKTPFPMLVRIGRFTFIQSPAYAVGWSRSASSPSSSRKSSPSISTQLTFLLPYRNAGSTASAIWHRNAAASSSKTSLLHIL